MPSLISRVPGLPWPHGAQRCAASLIAGCAAVWLALGASAAAAQDTPRVPLREPEVARQPAPEVDTEKEAYAKLPPCKLSDDGKHLAEEPCRTAKALEPLPRRPVPQAVERVAPAAQDEPKEPLPPRPPTPPRDRPDLRPGSAMVPAAPAVPAIPAIAAPAVPVAPAAPRSNAGAAPGVRPGAPIPAASCDAGGCYGPNGQRFNNGPGATVVGPSGKLCTRSGAWIQC